MPGRATMDVQGDLRDVDADRVGGMIVHAFHAPVLVMRASMPMYPFRTCGRTAATKLTCGPEGRA